mmetsp:Transcript_108375/g.215227  ORF Transcript_108375/g.215227 Transcript_108375/m.215227 type:complete len:256 (+) Transcript_108375:95-862(+)
MHQQLVTSPTLNREFHQTFLPGRSWSVSFFSAAGMHNARFKSCSGGASGEIFNNDHVPTPTNVKEKARVCVWVMGSPKRTQESATMKMSLVRPIKTNPTAAISLIATATITFSRKAKPAFAANRRQCVMAAGMTAGFQATVLATRRIAQQQGATNAVYVRGSNFRPLSTNSPTTSRPHSATWLMAWKAIPTRENRRSPETDMVALTITHTIRKKRSLSISCSPTVHEMRKTIMTFASFINCSIVTLQKMYAWFEP